MYGCLSKQLTSPQANQGGIEAPEGVVQCRLMTTAPSCYAGQLLGAPGGVQVWQRAACGEHTGRWNRLRSGRKLPGSEVDAHACLTPHTHPQGCRFMHSNRCTYISADGQTHKHLGSSQHLMGDGYFRREHSIRTRFASSSPSLSTLPFASPVPSFLVTAPLSLLCEQYMHLIGSNLFSIQIIPLTCQRFPSCPPSSINPPPSASLFLATHLAPLHQEVFLGRQGYG